MALVSEHDRLLNKIAKNREHLLQLLSNLPGTGTLVFTNGCFDLLHAGHVLYLSTARDLGDMLIVGVNDDDSVRSLNKGQNRPLNRVGDRMMVLAALSCVDFVFPFSEHTPEASIRSIRPDIHAKGGDYKPEDLPEKAAVEEGGGRIVIVPFVPGYSTTAILKRA